MREEKVKTLVLIAVAFAAVSVFAFQSIPKESAKALGVTRGKPFSSGMVFINGKYVEPPYVVERWGTGIRINSIPVTGQVIDWTEFLKTQPGVKVEKSETAVAPAKEPKPMPAPASVPEPSADVSASSLDDLFDDDPKPVKPAKVEPKAVAAAPVVSKPAKTVVTYVLSGKFRHNDDSTALLKRINANRTEIDRTLRSGGFICFGDSYSQVQGDRRTLLELLEVLPDGARRLLRAVAREGTVREPQSGEFVARHALRAASSVKTSLGMLLDKQLLYRDERGYRVYDRLLGEYLARQ